MAIPRKGLPDIRSHIATMRQVKSYRSCPTSTGLPLAGVDRGRMRHEEVARGRRELHRRWLADCLQKRLTCCR